MDEYTKDLKTVKGVGTKRLELFHKLGIDSVGALLGFYPRNYEDWSTAYTTSTAPFGENCCVKAVVTKPVEEHWVRKGMTLYRCTASDGVTDLKITIFNNKYAAAKLKEGETYLFYGTVGGNFRKREMSAPQIEQASSAKLRPIYHGTEGLGSRVIGETVKQALGMLDLNRPDFLPKEITEKYNLISHIDALFKIHTPVTMDDVNAARKRLIFEELFILQLGLLRLKGRNKAQTGAKITRDYTDEFLKQLPFSPTGAQLRAIREAVADFLGEHPMNRLLQGDVGSGKTAVAAALCYTMIKNGYQAALMAPTEILAEQHYRSLSAFLTGSGIRTMLLTGSTPVAEKKKIYTQLAMGEIHLIIGTHALIQDSVVFHKLGLVITDEQHRFGVEQRRRLSQKGENPHLYVMSATPIPRTLGLIIYGDLDISVLDEMPAHRVPIKTYLVGTSYRERFYGFIKKHLDAERQAYIVCPLIEESESDLVSAEEYYTNLSAGAFKNYRLGLLTGRMKGAEKDETMRRFASGEIQLLVSTTVVEVGVDVPNATVMVIENAERFGLSQLHQLRGRVGRGKHASFCILVSDSEKDETTERLKILSKTSDGFKIADEDLRLRGPGDFFGNQQHGLPKLKIADIIGDLEEVRATRAEAAALQDEDPELVNHPELAQRVNHLFEDGATNF